MVRARARRGRARPRWRWRGARPRRRRPRAAARGAGGAGEGEADAEQRQCYQPYHGSACVRAGIFEPWSNGGALSANATYDPLGGEGAAGVYALPGSFDAHTDALVGLFETIFAGSAEYPTECAEHLVRMSCLMEYRFCAEDANATVAKLELVSVQMQAYAANPEYDDQGNVVPRSFDTSPVVVPRLVCPEYCASNHTETCVDQLRYALAKGSVGCPRCQGCSGRSTGGSTAPRSKRCVGGGRDACARVWSHGRVRACVSGQSRRGSRECAAPAAPCARAHPRAYPCSHACANANGSLRS